LITGKDDYRDDLQQREQGKTAKANQNPKAKKRAERDHQPEKNSGPFAEAKAEESDIMQFSEANSDEDLDDVDSYDSEMDFDPTQANNKYKQRLRDEKKPYHQIKHVYDIQIRQL
jgi:hypothetical protein